jgi:drug/metabolite transporter (DMT)-like permease
MFALASMAMIGHGILTLADAKAMQIAEPAPFLFWTYCLVFVTQLLWFACTKPKARTLTRHLWEGWRLAPGRIVLAAAISYLSYILILLAFQRGGEAAAVAAIRQVSIPVSVILGALILREGMFGKRFAWSFVLAAGVAVILISG